MNRSELPRELPEPVRRYWRELAHLDVPPSLLDEVVAGVENQPRVARFAFMPVAAFVAATAAVVAMAVLDLSGTPPGPIGAEASARASMTDASPAPSATLPPGVVPIPPDPPLSTIPVFDAEIMEFDVGRIGSPVLAAHGSVWYVDGGTGLVTRVDASTGDVSAVIEVNPDPEPDAWDQLAAADEQSVYTVGFDETLVEIDAATNEIVRRIPIGTLPYDLELHDGDAYIADFDGGHVSRVDLAAGEVLWQVRAGVRPEGIFVSDDAVWVTLYGEAALLRLDPETGETLEGYSAYVFGMEIVHDGADGLITTGNQGRPVERFSISEGRITARIKEMTGAVMHEGRLYGLRREGQLVLLDSTTLEWQALLDSGTLEASLGAGEGALWIAEGQRLLKVEPNP